MAYDHEADETLYGGAGGGGKSDLLIGLGLTRHKRAVVFRRQKMDLKALKDRAKEVVGDFGIYHGQSNSIVTQDNRELEFGHCARPGDEMGWQGRAHDMYGFDELAQFVEHQYLFITAWLRSVDPNQRTRIICASNPPLTAEGFWLAKRWGPWLEDGHPNPAQSGELRWFATLDGQDSEVAGPEPFEHTDVDGLIELIKPRSRTFIQARLDDNPYYRDSGYKAVLQALPGVMRDALLHGKFGAAMEDDPWQVIPSNWIKEAQARWEPVPPDNAPMDVLGVDPARGGRDQMTMMPRHGDWFGQCKAIPGVDVETGVAAAGHVVQMLRDGAVVHIDNIGIGAACYEHLDGLGTPVEEMDARRTSTARDRSGSLGFYNQRAEWWWMMREALDPETGSNIALPPDPELLADLSAPKYEPTIRGVKIESKEDVQERLGRSTDKGDACVMALPMIRNVTHDTQPRRRLGRTPPPVEVEDPRLL